MLAQTRQSAPMVESTIVVPEPIVLPSPTEVRPVRMTFGSRTTSTSNRTPQSRYTVDGSRIVTPARMWASFMRTRSAHSACGELGAVVDAIERPVVVKPDGADDSSVLASQSHQFGEVQLTGRRRRLDGIDPPTEPCRVEGVTTGVDLVRIQLVGRGIAGLGDPLDAPELAPDHPPELARVRGVHACQGDGSVIHASLLENRQEVWAHHERDITRKHEHLGCIVWHGRESRTHRIRSSAWLILKGEQRSPGQSSFLKCGRRRRIDDDRR